MDHEEKRFAELKGKKKHYCPDWDYMAIDETCPEFEACCCEQYNPPKCPHCKDGLGSYNCFCTGILRAG